MEFSVRRRVLVPCSKTWNNLEQIAKNCLLYRERGASIRVGGGVRVNVRRRAQVGVPEQLLNEFQVPRFLVDDSRGRVPEGVESGSPATPSNAETVSDSDKSTIQEYGEVLVVDDDDSERDIICTYVRSLGYTALCASDGNAGCEIVLGRRGRIRMLISDLIMPNGGGWERVHRARTVAPGIAVVFISGIMPKEMLAHVCSPSPFTVFLKKTAGARCTGRVASVFLRITVRSRFTPAGMAPCLRGTD